jgi:hypothetical protein
VGLAGLAMSSLVRVERLREKAGLGWGCCRGFGAKPTRRVYDRVAGSLIDLCPSVSVRAGTGIGLECI